MQIFVKTLTGKTMAFDVTPNSTVANIKTQISDITGVGQGIDYCTGNIRSFDPHHLIYRGKELENAKSLGDYDIRHESILHLVFRTPGS